MNYYNENDPRAAEWIRELIRAGEIPDGFVDERSILEVGSDDLAGFVQCHFFAGIAGWSLALKLAGWPDDKPVWTGSCPCQPFSAAGKRKGQADERHLWPVWFNLVRQCRPERIFGEQVATAIGHGWLDGICADLGAEGYACGSAVLGAHSLNSPHIRQRLYWMAYPQGDKQNRSVRNGHTTGRDGFANYSNTVGLADSSIERRQQVARGASCDEGAHGRRAQGGHVSTGGREDGGLADADGGESRHGELQSSGRLVQQPENEVAGGVDNSTGTRCLGPIGGAEIQARDEARLRVSGEGCSNGGVGDTHKPGSQGQRVGGDGASERIVRAAGLGSWENYEFIPCADGKLRRIQRLTQSDFFPIFNGLSEILGDCWNEIILKLQEAITDYGKKEETRSNQELFSLWSFVGAAICRGYATFPEPEILLLALCELSRSSQSKIPSAAQNFARLCESSLRIVWCNSAFARSSQEWRLVESRSIKPSDTLHSLSSEDPQANDSSVQILLDKIAETRDVSVAFPEVEKIWRSILDQKAIRKRVEAGFGYIQAASGFPLSQKCPGRVTLLRGSGNSIVPELAAEFIQTCNEVIT